MTTFLDNAGRIELPQIVQAQLGLRPGDEVALEQEEGKWVLKAVRSARAAIDLEELNWADLDYVAVPLPQVGQVAVRIEQRGDLKPMPHGLDNE